MSAMPLPSISRSTARRTVYRADGGSRDGRAGRGRRGGRLRGPGAVLVVVVALGLLAIAFSSSLDHTVRRLALPLSNEQVIREQAAAKHLDPALIAAVIFAETKFDARTSPTGALGLMQIEPSTAEFLAKRSGATTFSLADLAHPDTNIAYGSYYLHYLLDRYGGNETLALAAYNGGETNVDGWLEQAHAAGVRFTVDAIPFAQTRAYVLRVEHAQLSYRSEYGL
jgi:soluble lytic murein transglycosylase